jgi:hypothetical protein
MTSTIWTSAFAALAGITPQQEELGACNLGQSTSAYRGILRSLQETYCQSPGACAA